MFICFLRWHDEVAATIQMDCLGVQLSAGVSSISKYILKPLKIKIFIKIEVLKKLVGIEEDWKQNMTWFILPKILYSNN